MVVKRNRERESEKNSEMGAEGDVKRGEGGKVNLASA